MTIIAHPTGRAQHGLTVLTGDGTTVTYVETGERRDDLFLAIGTYAAYLAGQARPM